MHQSDYNRFLDLAYDAAIDPDVWPAVLHRFADLTGAQTALLIQQDEETGKGQAIRFNVDPSAAEPYYGHFATRNVLHKPPNPREFLRTWSPRVLTDEHKVPKPDLMRTEYYNDFMRRFGIHSVLMLRIAVVGMDTVTINLTRPANRPQFESAEIELGRRLHPHLIRAFSLGQKMAAARILRDDMADTLDHSPHGLFLVDASGRVRHINSAGRALLAEQLGLNVSGGRLSATRSDRARELEAMIAAAACADPDRRTGGSMSIELEARRLPLSVTVAPARSGRGPIFESGPSVIVCVSDLEAGVSLPEQRVQRLFGLTPAETRLALALFEGATAQEAATRFGVSHNTVRVHLARIFDKTGAKRQSDLIRLMMRAVGVNLA